MPTPPQSTSWIGVAIGLSVALNLFLLAFLGAQAWHPFAPESPAGLSEAAPDAETLNRGFLRRLTASLPPEDARLVRRAVLSRLPEMLAVQLEAYRALERLRADAAERPYNADKVKADLDALQTARQRMPPITSQMLQELLPQLSDDGRLALSRFRLFPHR